MITVFGSFVIDVLTPVPHLPGPGETVIGENYRLKAGGKGANQAIAAARTGARVRFFGATGKDAFADIGIAALLEAGVDCAGLERVSAPTALGLVVVDGTGQNQIAVAAGANREVRANQLTDDAFAPDGTLVLQLEIPEEENWVALRRAGAAGVRTILNAAPAAPVPLSALQALDLLIVNEHEAVMVAKAAGLRHADPLTAGEALHAAISRDVVVTLGPAGSVAWRRDGVLEVAALSVPAVDATGAGDAYVGAFAAALDAGRSFEEAMHRASVAGSLACTEFGAQEALPSARVIESRLGDLAAPRTRA